MTAGAGPGETRIGGGRGWFSQVRPGLHLGLGWQRNRDVGLELRHGFSRVGGHEVTVHGTLGGAAYTDSVGLPDETFRRTTLSLVVRF